MRWGQSCDWLCTGKPRMRHETCLIRACEEYPSPAAPRRLVSHHRLIGRAPARCLVVRSWPQSSSDPIRAAGCLRAPILHVSFRDALLANSTHRFRLLARACPPGDLEAGSL
jgi:hypothetical protein